MSSPPSTSSRCPECGAALRLSADRCWMCGAMLRHGPEEPQFVETTLVERETATAATFSLSSLFLVMTLVAVGAGVFAAAPGLGILFAILAAPALLRTIVVTAKQKARGTATTPGQKIVAFLGSVGVVLIVVLSIGVALFTACLTACAGFAAAGDKGIVPANKAATIVGQSLVVGGMVGMALAGLLLWLIWRWQRKA